MARQIWKYQLKSRTTLAIPQGAKILCAHEQQNDICIWAEVDPARPAEDRTFEVFGTGHAMPESNREYIGTAFLGGGHLVFHVYEARESGAVS